MTPEAFLKEFNIFINAPNGINELRRFVIDLAVKGKLIDQATMDSTDNSTFEWELESLRLKESEIWEPEFWITDPPTNWLKCPLAHIGNWGSGGTPKRSNSDYFGGSIPWVVIGDLTNGYVSQSAEQITKLGLEMSSAKMIPTGSVLFAMYGASIGKLGITEFECCTNQAIAHCIPDERFINAEYLLLLLSSLKQEFINKGKRWCSAKYQSNNS